MDANDQEKHAYLTEWGWRTEEHQAGFTVYFHTRFPGTKYRIGKAYEKMKANEPSMEPVLTVQKDDPEAAEKIRALMDSYGIPLPPKGDRKNEGLIYEVFGDPVESGDGLVVI